MGALFGFTGFPDKKLIHKMKKTLNHRGKVFFDFIEEKDITICINSSLDEKLRNKCQEGIYKRGNTIVAVSGYLTNIGDNVNFENYLFENIEKYGIKWFYKLNGAFIIAVYSGKDFYLIRDGAGVKTVYYAKSEKKFLFSSEPKGILCDNSFKREIDETSLAKYLTFSFVPGTFTMLKNLYELESGHLLCLKDLIQVEKKRWFLFEDIKNRHKDLNEREWADLFYMEFGDAVEKRLYKGIPTGVFLSGGIDSSVVTAEASKRHDSDLYTYSIHFGDRYLNELEYSNMIAKKFNTIHKNVLITPKDFLPRLRKIIWHMDDPVGDPVTVPNFELAKTASKDVSHILNGEGGDPCFGGPKNIPMLLHHWYGGLKRDDLFFEKKYLESFQRAYSEIDLILNEDIKSKFSKEDDLAKIITPFFNTNRPEIYLDKLQAANIRLKASHLIYPKVERMTGAFGLTPYSPLTDEGLIKLSFMMPAKMKLNKGIEKYVIKKAYKDIIPNEIIERPKSGMRVPVKFWFQGELKKYAKHILSKKNIQRAGIFDYSRVKQILDYNKEEGKGRYGIQLWMLITFEIWRRIIVEGENI